MSIQSQIDRINANILKAYSAIFRKGGQIPQSKTSENLEEAIESIPVKTLEPKEVYKKTRPSDWLPMPEVEDDEIYLLFHIPDGLSSLLAFTVSCTGLYTVAVGSISDGAFIEDSAISLTSGEKYETELFGNDFGNVTIGGMKQCMVKISGMSIKTWKPSTHSRKTDPTGFASWNIVEILCKLPNGIEVKCPGSTSLRYFSLVGSNKIVTATKMFDACRSLIAIPQLDTSNVTNMSYMFNNCYSLIAIPQLDTSNVTNMSSMFYSCHSLTIIPQLDTSNVTNMSSMFNNCRGLDTIPQLDTSNVTNMSTMFNNCRGLHTIPQLDTSNVTNMSSMFIYCYSLTTIPQLDMSNVTNMSDMFNDCRSLISIPQLDTLNATNMDNAFANCYGLEKLILSNNTGWAGVDISLSGCSLSHLALVDLFNSLPTITNSRTLTLTGNPGISELTDSEKEIATNKNWILAL